MRKLAPFLLLLLMVSTPASAFSTDDLLSLVAMPLAVAAVSDMTGVPQDELANLVAALNQANVPPPQFVEVIRYVPVALVDDGQPFIEFVHTQTSQGITGPAIVPVIVERLRTYYPAQTEITVTAPAEQPRVIVVDRDYVPRVVVTRVAEVRAHPAHPVHPHGGPPGQLKKQTVVVHERRPVERVVVTTPHVRPMNSSSLERTKHDGSGKDKHEKHGGGKKHGKG